MFSNTKTTPRGSHEYQLVKGKGYAQKTQKSSSFGVANTPACSESAVEAQTAGAGFGVRSLPLLPSSLRRWLLKAAEDATQQFDAELLLGLLLAGLRLRLPNGREHEDGRLRLGRLRRGLRRRLRFRCLRRGHAVGVDVRVHALRLVQGGELRVQVRQAWNVRAPTHHDGGVLRLAQHGAVEPVPQALGRGPPARQVRGEHGDEHAGPRRHHVLAREHRRCRAAAAPATAPEAAVGAPAARVQGKIDVKNYPRPAPPAPSVALFLNCGAFGTECRLILKLRRLPGARVPFNS